jgi:hypothetical protein
METWSFSSNAAWLQNQICKWNQKAAPLQVLGWRTLWEYLAKDLE